MTNLILIDKTLPDIDIILSSLSENTKPLVFDPINDTFSQIVEKVQSFGFSFSTMGIMWENRENSFFRLVETTNRCILDKNDGTNLYTWKSFFDFLSDLIKFSKTKMVDFITCSIGSDPNWVVVINKLKQKTGIVARVSTKLLGNVGNADWAIGSGELTNNLSKIYFNDMIKTWNHNLGGTSDYSRYFAVIDSSGYVYTCGQNIFGQLGDGTRTDSSVLVQMLKGNALSNDATYVNNIKMVSCGEYHTVLLDNSGYVYACGRNNNGQLGDGTTNNSSVLVQMLAGNALSNDGTYVNNIKMISCGQFYTLLLDNSGYVYACGSNSFGQFGDGTTNNTSLLVQMISGNVLFGQTIIQSIACGQRTSFVLDNSGYVYGCGYNVDGQLGDGTTTNSSQLVRMLSGNALSNDGTYVTNIKEITIGIQSTTVLDNSGYVYSCGNNRGGQFGIGIGNSSNTLVQMLSGESVHGDVYGVNNVSHISCSGRNSIMILDASGYVYGTGSNDFGILGIGNITLTSTLVRILAGQAQNYDSLGVTNIGGITSSHYNAYLLDLSGYIYGCGRNKYGELGINSSVQNQTTLVQMLSGNVLPADSTATGFAQNMVRMMDSNSIALPQNLPTVICFKEGTKILALNSQFVDEFIPVEELKQGDLIKTHKHGYKKLESIGFSNIYNSGDDERTKNRLYIYKKQDIQELAEDVVVTGCHSVLVDRLTEKEKEETIKQTKRVFVTDDKYRLMAFLDSASKPYTDEGNFKIWHFCLENENIYMNYGVFAGGTTYGNAKPGLLVESASHFSLKTYSNMTIITNSAITNQ